MMFPKSMRFKIVFQSVLTVVICFSFLTIISYNKIKAAILDNHISLTISSIDRKYENVLLFENLIENIAGHFINDNNIKDIIRKDNYNYNLSYNLNSLKNTNLNIIGAMILSTNGYCYASNTIYDLPTYADFLSVPEYNDFVKSDKTSLWLWKKDVSWSYQYITTSKSGVIVYLTKVVLDDQYIGTLILTIQTQSLLPLLDNNISNSKENTKLMLVKTGQTPFYYNINTPLNKDINSEIENLISSNKKYMLTSNKSDIIIARKYFEPDVYLVSIVSLSNLLLKMNILTISLFVTLLLLSILFIFMYNNLAEGIFTPLKKLYTEIKQYRQNIK